jgi:hypothetical protein
MSIIKYRCKGCGFEWFPWDDFDMPNFNSEEVIVREVEKCDNCVRR